MNRKILLAYSCLAFGGCLGSAATNVGDSDQYPLFRVDTKSLPINVTDDKGVSAQIVGGYLIVYSGAPSATYHIVMANGKSVDGQKDINHEISNVLDGVEITVDLSSDGGPTGTHSFDFNTTEKQCVCGKFCNRACIGDRLADTVRSYVGSGSAPRIEAYRTNLLRR